MGGSRHHLKGFPGGPHPSTIQALTCFTSEARRDPVHPDWYDRRHFWHPSACCMTGAISTPRRPSGVEMASAIGQAAGCQNCRRPYQLECTGSLLTPDVNQVRAWIVLGWGTAWEALEVLTAFPHDLRCETLWCLDSTPRDGYPCALFGNSHGYPVIRTVPAWPYSVTVSTLGLEISAPGPNPL